MFDIVRKYAKDLRPGDRINVHKKGLLLVRSVFHIPCSTRIAIALSDACGNFTRDIVDSYAVFNEVLTEV